MRFFSFFLTWILATGSLFLFNANAQDPCTGPNIYKIERPYYPDRKDSPKFTYSFEIIPGAAPEQPYVIYLPGGPGDTSIGANRQGISPGYNVIKTDPRGAGCNQRTADAAKFPMDAYSTAYLASDILAIISEVRPAHYYLYGFSFGTQLATITASMAQSMGHAPEALILVGVVGRSYRPREQTKSWEAVWNRFEKTLPRDIKAKIESKSPLGVSEQLWGGFIGSMLSLGGTRNIENLLKPLSNTASAEEQAVLKKMVKAFGQNSTEDVEAPDIARAILCQENNFNWNQSLSLWKGRLLVAGENKCEGLTLTHPFDSSDFQITSPIYYFQAEDDVSTPLFQARYHFRSQKKSERYFVTLPTGGHMTFRSQLFDCMPEIWSSIFSGGAGLRESLNKCKSKPALEHAKPRR